MSSKSYSPAFSGGRTDTGTSPVTQRGGHEPSETSTLAQETHPVIQAPCVHGEKSKQRKKTILRCNSRSVSAPVFFLSVFSKNITQETHRPRNNSIHLLLPIMANAFQFFAPTHTQRYKISTYSLETQSATKLSQKHCGHKLQERSHAHGGEKKKELVA